MSTDTTVLYWAKEYYKNYTALLERLEVTLTLNAKPELLTRTLGAYEQSDPGTPIFFILSPGSDIVRDVDMLVGWG